MVFYCGVGIGFGGVGCWTQQRTTSPCGGRRSLFFASAKKTNEKKADPAGGRAIRLFGGGDSVVRAVASADMSYRFPRCTTARHTGFVVQPLMAGALPIRPSAVRGANGRESSRFTGFVVLSLTASAVIVQSLPFAEVGAAQFRNDGFRGGRGGPCSIAGSLAHEVAANRPTPSPDPSVFADRATVPTQKRRRLYSVTASAGTAGCQLARYSPSETKPRNQQGTIRCSNSRRERQMWEQAPRTRSGAPPRNPWVMRLRCPSSQ